MYGGYTCIKGRQLADQHHRLSDFDENLSVHYVKEAPATPPGYPLLSAGIKAGSRLAIWLSERI